MIVLPKKLGIIKRRRFERRASAYLKGLILVALFGAYVPIAQAYTKLVIFGDSLSDTGNHPGALLGLVYPYYQNRISNGPVAVDVLAASLGLSASNSGYLFGNGSGSNYSVSGANAAGNDPHDLTAQLNAYLNQAPANLGTDILYLVMIGGNDVRDAAAISDINQGRNATNTAADAVKTGLERLLQRGAKSILVSNVPDISLIPETTDRSASNAGILSRAAQLSTAFNQRVSQHISNLESTHALNILEFDFFARFNSLISNPATYGFSNTSEACFNFSPYYFHPSCNFEGFVFFDSIHPSAKTHALIAETMLAVIENGEQLGVAIIPAITILLLD